MCVDPLASNYVLRTHWGRLRVLEAEAQTLLRKMPLRPGRGHWDPSARKGAGAIGLRWHYPLLDLSRSSQPEASVELSLRAGIAAN